jgi:DNA-binding transcriptional MerR regulator
MAIMKSMPRHFTISTFGKLTGLTPRALRLYAQEGLLQTEVVNAKTGYRHYAQSQAQVAERIRLLRSIDMPLEDIRTILTEQSTKPGERLLLEHKKRIEKLINNYQEALHALENLSARDIHASPIAIKNIPAQPVICIQQQTSLLRIEIMRARAFGELYGFLKRENIAAVGAGFSENAKAGNFEPHEEINLDNDWLIDICVPVADVIANPRVQSRVFPARRVASVTHIGPYQPLFQVYQRIAGWINEQGLTHTGQTREIYHLGLSETRQPNDLKTEIQFYLE